MTAMDQLQAGRIHPGMDVCDVDGHKIGTVARLYRHSTGDRENVVEVKTGILGLGKHLFIPQQAVHDVTEAGVFLSGRRGSMDEQHWSQRPDDLEDPSSAPIAAAPTVSEAVIASPTDRATPDTGPDAGNGESWEQAMPRYRARWVEHYKMPNANWENYQDRYRFAWEMQRSSDLTSQSWYSVQPALRSHWEVRHPNVEWETVADSIRDVWEHADQLTGGSSASNATAQRN